jgi:hypothetical protein
VLGLLTPHNLNRRTAALIRGTPFYGNLLDSCNLREFFRVAAPENTLPSQPKHPGLLTELMKVTVPVDDAGFRKSPFEDDL